PADARLIEAIDLQVNESALTGESIPSKKKIDEMPKGTSLPDRDNMVYAGTTVVHGLGMAVIISVGKNTEIGKIAELVKSAKEEKTPLQIKLQNFSRLLGVLFAFICIFIVVIGLIQKREFLEMVETGVAVGVASIPEGLTIAVTFILALGMQQILKEKALTRKLVAAETLGSTTVICTDKTGTLTEGKMHVAHIVVGKKEFEVKSPGSRQDSKEAKLVSLALQTAMMCNDAIVENPEDELREWKIIGSPTESALLSAAIQSGLRKEELLKKEPLIDELPFDSEKKYMISLNSKDKKNYILYEKGAAERILEKTKKYYHLGGIHTLDEKGKKSLLKTYENLTSRGLRVIGLATKEFKNKKTFEKGKVNWDEIDTDLTFVGFIAIKDPLRPEARETIDICRRAGIRPIMITGDHKLTAKAIAVEVGMNVKSENIYTGEDLEKIDDKELEKLVSKIDIYARVSPHHKLRIVKALQARGEVVAMTGDGINDSPALKAADIGISLGTGTDVAKETSDIILLDDNFATIVSAVKQGRIIFNNIRKVITYLISDSFSEMIVITGSIILNTPLAVLPAQILWINIVNDAFPNFALAFEKGDGSVMRQKPIPKKEPLLNKEMKLIIFFVGITRDILVFSIFLFFFKNDLEINYLRTLIFTILGVDSLMYVFSIKNLNK
ncbi:MAG: ATPase, partial [Candidatus Levybacteria bacterium CG10_big_fil_rev_8_21_14_0_10_36_7]